MHLAAEKRTQFLASCSQKDLVSLLVGLFIGFPECHGHMAAGFPRGGVILERAKEEAL